MPVLVAQKKMKKKPLGNFLKIRIPLPIPYPYLSTISIHMNILYVASKCSGEQMFHLGEQSEFYLNNAKRQPLWFKRLVLYNGVFFF